LRPGFIVRCLLFIFGGLGSANHSSRRVRIQEKSFIGKGLLPLGAYLEGEREFKILVLYQARTRLARNAIGDEAA